MAKGNPVNFQEAPLGIGSTDTKDAESISNSGGNAGKAVPGGAPSGKVIPDGAGGMSTKTFGGDVTKEGMGMKTVPSQRHSNKPL